MSIKFSEAEIYLLKSLKVIRYAEIVYLKNLHSGGARGQVVTEFDSPRVFCIVASNPEESIDILSGINIDIILESRVLLCDAGLIHKKRYTVESLLNLIDK